MRGRVPSGQVEDVALRRHSGRFAVRCEVSVTPVWDRKAQTVSQRPGRALNTLPANSWSFSIYVVARGRVVDPEGL